MTKPYPHIVTDLKPLALIIHLRLLQAGYPITNVEIIPVLDDVLLLEMTTISGTVECVPLWGVVLKRTN